MAIHCLLNCLTTDIHHDIVGAMQPAKMRFLVFATDSFGGTSFGGEDEFDLEEVRPALPPIAGDAVLVRAEDWYRERMPVCGTMESWASETVTGRDYETRTPHFVGFLLLGVKVTAEAAAVVDLAIKVGKGVYVVAEGELRRVSKIQLSPRGEGTVDFGVIHG